MLNAIIRNKKQIEIMGSNVLLLRNKYGVNIDNLDYYIINKIKYFISG